MSQRTRLFSVLVLLMAVAMSMMFVPSAKAGCITAQVDCSDCAQKAMWEAMKRLSFRGITRANMQLWDCSIDFFHCVVFGQHHTYPCAV